MMLRKKSFLIYLLKNANNNDEHELLVRPSDFGYNKYSNGTEECMKCLGKSGCCTSVEKISGNLIRVKVKA